MKNFLSKFLLFFILSLLISCSNFSERYYFRVQDPDMELDPAYFRVNISGTVFFSESRYSAGFYPRKAVEQLFGEIKMEGDRAELEARAKLPEKIRNQIDRYENRVKEAEKIRKEAAKFVQKVQDGIQSDSQITDDEQKQLDMAKANLEKFDKVYTDSEKDLKEFLKDVVKPENATLLDATSGAIIDLEKQKMVLFMTANNDALAGVIKQIAEEEQIVNNAVTILNREKNEELASIELDKREVLENNRFLYELLQKKLEEIKTMQNDPSKLGNIKTLILKMSNDIACQYESPRFDSVKEAEKWLEDNSENFRYKK